MYFGGSPLGGGHVSTGVNGESFRWYFAEGATGLFFRTYLLLASTEPMGPAGAPVTITYFPAGRSR